MSWAMPMGTCEERPKPPCHVSVSTPNKLTPIFTNIISKSSPVTHGT